MAQFAKSNPEADRLARSASRRHNGEAGARGPAAAPVVNVRKTYWLPSDAAEAFREVVDDLFHTVRDLDKSVVIGALLEAAIAQKQQVLADLKKTATEKRKAEQQAR